MREAHLGIIQSLEIGFVVKANVKYTNNDVRFKSKTRAQKINKEIHEK